MGGGSLEDAYYAGTLLAYSNISGSNGLITNDNKRSGWKVWEGAAVLDLKYINAGYSELGDANVAWLSYDGVNDAAYLITAEFANQFQSDGNQKLGSAAGDMFRLSGASKDSYTAYQNFNNGYIKSESGTTSVVNGKNVVLNDDGTGVTEVDAVATQTGFVGAATTAAASAAGVTQAAFTQTFIDAYNKYAEEGYDVGDPFSPVMLNGQNSGGDARYGTLCSQNFRNGDSVSNPWNDSSRSNWCFLAYNFEEGKVYLIADEFHYAFETTVENATSLGDPTSDAFLASDGNRYQNFENGYMMAEGSKASNVAATVVIGYNALSDGTTSEINLDTRVGKLGNTVTDSVIPDGYSATTFSEAFKTAYATELELLDDETITSVALVIYSNGFIYQLYTDNNGATHMLAYIAATDEFIYLRPAVYEAYSGNTDVGYPIAARITAAETTNQTIYAYPFSNGYIKFTVSEQQTIENGQIVTVTNEYAALTVGSIYDEGSNFFETTNYSANITASTVSDDVISKAYWSDYWGITAPTKEEIAAAFVEAYNEAFELGFSCGVPSDEGIVWWTTSASGVIKLTLKGGNGTANFWGDNTLMTYNPEDGKVYITTGKIADTYASDGASGNGWATTDMLINTATGVVVQQFNITDTDVTDRMIYIILENGIASKVSGTYDFDANAGNGEWVKYISQFGGSISSTVISVESQYLVGEAITIDFSQYVVNDDGYSITWTLVSGNGTLSDAGVYTYTPSAAGTDSVIVTVQSVFDKLTFSVSLNAVMELSDDTEDPTETDPSETDTSDTDEEEKGCGSIVAVGAGLGGAIAVVAVATLLIIVCRRRNKSE